MLKENSILRFRLLKKSECVLLTTVSFFFLMFCHCSRTPIDHYDKGLAYFRESNYSRAIEELRTALEEGHISENLLRKLVTSYQNSNRLSKANQYFRQLIKRSPQNPDFEFAAGLTLLAGEKHEEALRLFKNSIESGSIMTGPYTEFVLEHQRRHTLDQSEQFFSKRILYKGKNSLVHYGLGLTFALQDNQEKALSNFRTALGEDPSILAAYQEMSRVFFKTSQFKEAIEIYKNGIKAAKKEGNDLYEGKFMGSMGAMYVATGKFDSALVLLQKAVEKSEKAAELIDQGRWLGNMGNAYFYLGQPLKAIKQFRSAAQIASKVGDQSSELVWVSNIGGIYISISEYEKSLDYLKNALRLVKKTEDRRTEMNVLGNIGNAYGYLGNYYTALAYFDSALALSRSINDKIGQLKMTGNIGKAYGEIGEYSKALYYLHQATEQADECGDFNTQAIDLQAIGNIYMELKEDSLARDYFERALRIAEKIDAKRLRGISLLNIGSVSLGRGNLTEGKSQFQEALKIFKAIPDPKNQSVAFEYLGQLYGKQHSYAKAITHLDSALKISQKINYGLGIGEQQNLLGKVYLQMGDLDSSQACFAAALHAGELRQVPKIIWEAHYGLAKTALQRDEKQLSLAHLQKAIEAIEAVRIKVPGQITRSTFFASVQSIYQDIVDLVYDMHNENPNQNYNIKAFEYSERSRARAFLDILTDSKVHIQQGISQEARQENQKLEQAVIQIHNKLLEKNVTPEQIKSLNNQLKNAKQRLKQHQKEIARKNPVYEQISDPQVCSIRDIQNNVLGQQDILLEYFLGNINSYLWMINKNDVRVYTLASREKIENEVERYLDQLSEPSMNLIAIQHSGLNLFKILLAPVHARLNPGRRLIIVPDGILHYLPFESLVLDGEQNTPKYLISEFAISYAPSASVLNFLVEQPDLKSSRNIFAMGDPLYSLNQPAPKLADAFSGDIWNDGAGSLRGNNNPRRKVFTRLPYSSVEVNRIGQFYQNADNQILLGKDATEETIKHIDLKNYGIIHLAAHGMIDEMHPERSCIVLTQDDDPSEDGFLQMNEIFNLSMNAKLVVLSACGTGRGRLIRGEGIIGFSRAFFYSGARSLLVSLWPVNDQSTALLMERFYSGLQKGMSNAEALRQAKLSLLNSTNSVLHNPYYWAPFVLTGDSR